MLSAPLHLDLTKLLKSAMISKPFSLRFILLKKITKSFPLRHSFFFHLSADRSRHLTALCIIGCSCMLTPIMYQSRSVSRSKLLSRFHVPSHFLEIFFNALYRFRKKIWEPLLLLSSKEWSLISIHLDARALDTSQQCRRFVHMLWLGGFENILIVTTRCQYLSWLYHLD